tara:strand:+ start:374 stop:1612 length:1239 start_codon:yes stop_codon:yes gene_type:complete
MKPSYKPINIALIFDQEVSSGGGYQQGINAALLALRINPKLANILFFHTKNSLKNNLKNNGIHSELININILKKLYLYIKTTEKFRVIYKFFKLIFDFNFFEAYLEKREIDLVYFISPSRYALDLEKINFIFTIWDLCHRDHIEFPEIKLKGEFENRELRINYAIKRAISIIVDSEYGKSNLSQKYNFEEKRICVIPFEPILETKEKIILSRKLFDLIDKYKIRNKYIFYPAQFWPHKNHIYILKAINILEKKHNIKISIVFSGGDKGNKEKINLYSKKIGIQDRLIFTGFISNKELIALYKNSIALVMPTFFGPTNLPPLEAFNLGVPVIYPDSNGLREQVGDAALLINLSDPNTLSNCLLKLLNNNDLKNDLIERGYKRAKENKNYDRIGALENILISFISKYTTFQNMT